MRLDDIVIQEKFTTPSKRKVKLCRKNYKLLGKLDRDIVIDENNFLVDGYVAYLIAKEKNLEDVEAIYESQNINKPNIYIFGTHMRKGCIKEYTWKVKESGILFDVGDIALVKSKNTFTRITVTRIERLSAPPIDMEIKNVFKKINKKNKIGDIAAF